MAVNSAEEAHGAGHVHDSSVRSQDGQQDLRNSQVAEKVGAQRFSGLLAERLRRSAVEGYGRIVDQDVQAAVIGFQVLAESDDARFVVDVQLMKTRAQTESIQFLDRGSAAGLVSRRQVDDTVEFPAQFLDDRQSDAFIGTGDLKESNFLRTCLKVTEMGLVIERVNSSYHGNSRSRHYLVIRSDIYR